MYYKSDINFIAIDFETATSRRASICEVGICVVRNGEVAETRSWLVRPEDNYYQYWNIKVHGIRPQDTENAPDFMHHRAGDDAEMCARLFLRELESTETFSY